MQQFLTNFLQIRAHQFHLFIGNLAILAVVYRLVAMMILVVRVRFISKAH